MGSLHSVCPRAQNYECSLWGNAAAPRTGFEFQITFQELQLLQGALVRVGWKLLAHFRRLLVSCTISRSQSLDFSATFSFFSHEQILCDPALQYILTDLK